jgi:16S rRNA (cytosine967-C5)-methyltransferase
MLAGARAQAVIELIDLWEDEGAPADALMSNYCRDRKYIGSKDRQFIGECFFNILRHRGQIEAILNRTGSPVTPDFQVYTYLLRFENWKLPNLVESCKGQYAPKPLSKLDIGKLEKVAAFGASVLSFPEQYSIPEFLYATLQKVFGNSLEAEIKAMNQHAPLDLRVNTLKTDRKTMLGILKSAGFEVAPTPYSPWGIRLQGRPNIMGTSFYREGFVEVQDEGSQLVALACDAKPGMTVLDYCAGAGGKTLGLAATMENKGRLIASDIMAHRLQRSQQRLRRAGIHNTTVIAMDDQPKWVKRHQKFFDRVLVDVPCTGSGTWRRNPDSKWKISQDMLDNVCQEQQQILDTVAPLVKPGGWLIYATCSILPEENEQQIEQFLATHPDYTLIPIANILGNMVQSNSTHFLKLTPFQNETDGFFTAVLQKVL